MWARCHAMSCDHFYSLRSEGSLHVLSRRRSLWDLLAPTIFLTFLSGGRYFRKFMVWTKELNEITSTETRMKCAFHDLMKLLILINYLINHKLIKEDLLRILCSLFSLITSSLQSTVICGVITMTYRWEESILSFLRLLWNEIIYHR